MRRLVFVAPILILFACSDRGSFPTSLISEDFEARPATPAAAWTAKVTGGGLSYNVNTCNHLYQNVSAKAINGTARGQVQITTYLGTGTYPSCVVDAMWFQYHAIVTDLVLGTAPDGSRVANVCYDVTHIQHPAPFPLNLRFGIAIKEGGKGSGDLTRRAIDITCAPGEFWGDEPSEGFPAVMQDGNYTIHEK